MTRNHARCEKIGQTLRGYMKDMKDMKRIAVGG